MMTIMRMTMNKMRSGVAMRFALSLGVCLMVFLSSNVVSSTAWGNGMARHDYRSGDIIRTMRQSVFDAHSTGWQESVASQSPRFMHDHTLRFPTLEKITGENQTYYKIAFSFADDRFITPMVTISDGKGNLLESLTIKFIYSENDIVDFRWSTEYPYAEASTSEHTRKKLPEFFYVHYQWERFADKNSDVGMAFLFFSGIASALAMFLYILIDSGAETAPKISLPTRMEPGVITGTPIKGGVLTPQPPQYDVPMRQRSKPSPATPAPTNVFQPVVSEPSTSTAQEVDKEA